MTLSRFSTRNVLTKLGHEVARPRSTNLLLASIKDCPISIILSTTRSSSSPTVAASVWAAKRPSISRRRVASIIETRTNADGNQHDFPEGHNVNVHEISTGAVYRDAGVTVSGFPTKHAMSPAGTTRSKHIGTRIQLG